MARRSNDTDALYVISIAAELAGVHPQTLRVYERKGLIQPRRTEGNTRRYSSEDIQRLRRIQDLTHEGINLAGVMRIMELEERVARLEGRFQRVVEEADLLRAQLNEAVDARDRSSMVPLRDVRRVRRAMKADFIDEAGRRRTFAAPPVQKDSR